MAVSMLGIMGMLGMSVDVGRLYIARNESQVYVDSAALAAALRLNGDNTGITNAKNAVTASLNRWDMGLNQFSGTEVVFSTDAAGPWSVNPASAADVRFVRVTSQANMPIYFIPVFRNQLNQMVNARAIAGQVPKTSFTEGGFPFSPVAHNGNGPHFGLETGKLYTLRWASNPKENGPNVCPGDNKPNIIAQAEAGGGSERGFIEETSASNIREAIVANYQTRPVYVGGTVDMTGGAKQTQRDSIMERIGQDSDPTSTTFANYTGNGRRIVVVPINTWHPDYRVLGFAAFFLQVASEYPNGGNKSFCGEYIGPFVQGSKDKGAGQGGAYVVRLVL